jgi:transposase InsO family protein
MAQNKFDAKVKKIRSDNDTEFKNTQVENFLDEERIKHEFLAPYTPQKNGVAERRIILSSRWQEACLMNTRPRIGFGWRRSTRRIMQLTASSFTSS